MKYFLELFSATPLKVRLASGFLLLILAIIAIVIPYVMLFVLLTVAILTSCFIVIDYFIDN
jgi:hypothetical protein